MKVRLGAAAEVDLEQIGDWIARDSPRSARAFVRDLRRACETLGDHPERFQAVPGSPPAAGLRRRAHGRYLIYFVVAAGEVRVLRIVHGARNQRATVEDDA